MTMTARTTLTLLVALSVMTAAPPALAQNNQFGVAGFNWDGSPLTSFSGDGRVTTTFPPASGAWPHAMVVSSSRLIVAGGDYHGRFVLAAYQQATGALDLTFGTGGRVATAIAPGTHAEAFAIAVASNGDIVVAGSAVHTDDNRSRFALARYDYVGNELWKVETSFPGANDGGATDCGGALPTSLYHDDSSRGVIPNGDAARAVAIDASGRIVVAGYSRTATDGRIALARYDSTAVLDPAFNGDGDADGLIVKNLDSNSDPAQTDCEQANGVTFHGSNIIVAGSRIASAGASFDTEALVLRYAASGAPNVLFGSLGVARPLTATVASIDRSFSANAVQIADDKILIAGRGALDDCCGPYFAVARLNASNGSLDTTFSGDGKAFTGFGMGPLTPGEATAMEVRGSSVTVAGWSGNFPSTLFVLARYNLSNGSLDTTFELDGTAKTDFLCRSKEAATAIAITPPPAPWQTVKRIFVAGHVAPSCAWDTIGPPMVMQPTGEKPGSTTRSR
jgi:uncharacterized delta-60 repeat protein